MRITVVFLSALMVAGILGVMGTVSAQENEEIVQLERRFRMAQDELEAAAREVARLSAQSNAPDIGVVIRDFRLSGRRAMLGINIEDIDEGVLVAGVSPGGPADESGVETGDIITAIDAAELTASEINSPTEVLIGQMAHVEPGDTVVLSISRDDEEHEIEIEARAPEAQFFASPTGPFPQGDFRLGGPNLALNFTRPIGPWAEMELVELTPQLGAYFGTDNGILVVRAPSDDEIELQDGDVIIEIGGRTPMSTEHAMRILGSFEPGETLELTIMRDQRRQTLELELAARDRRG